VVTHPVNPSDLALALGRIPTGLYVVSTLADGKPLGFVGSFLMQVGFQPPTLCVAIANGREHLAAIKSHGKFSVSILDAASQKLMGAFFKKAEPGKSPFDGLAVIRTPGARGRARLARMRAHGRTRDRRPRGRLRDRGERRTPARSRSCRSLAQERAFVLIGKPDPRPSR
jgi:hypothetical protein